MTKRQHGPAIGSEFKATVKAGYVTAYGADYTPEPWAWRPHDGRFNGRICRFRFYGTFLVLVEAPEGAHTIEVVRGHARQQAEPWLIWRKLQDTNDGVSGYLTQAVREGLA